MLPELYGPVSAFLVGGLNVGNGFYNQYAASNDAGASTFQEQLGQAVTDASHAVSENYRATNNDFFSGNMPADKIKSTFAKGAWIDTQLINPMIDLWAAKVNTILVSLVHLDFFPLRLILICLSDP